MQSIRSILNEWNTPYLVSIKSLTRDRNMLFRDFRLQNGTFVVQTGIWDCNSSGCQTSLKHSTKWHCHKLKIELKYI